MTARHIKVASRATVAAKLMLDDHMRRNPAACLARGTDAADRFELYYLLWIQSRWDDGDEWVRSVWEARP